MSIRSMAAAVAITAGLTLSAAGLAVGTAGPALAASGTGAVSAVQLTGVQLLAALLPASAFPAGYKLDKTSVYDSGSRLLTAPAKYNLATVSCTSFAKHFGQRGFGETAVASDFFIKGGTTLGPVRGFGQLVYQFKTSRAATAVFNGLRAIIRKCPQAGLSGTGPGSGVKVTTKVFDAAPIGGHRTFQVNQTATVKGFSLGAKLVFTVAGQDVFLTGNIGILAAPPSSPSPRTTMLRLINRVRAFR